MGRVLQSSQQIGHFIRLIPLVLVIVASKGALGAGEDFRGRGDDLEGQWLDPLVRLCPRRVLPDSDRGEEPGSRLHGPVRVYRRARWRRGGAANGCRCSKRDREVYASGPLCRSWELWQPRGLSERQAGERPRGSPCHFPIFILAGHRGPPCWSSRPRTSISTPSRPRSLRPSRR